MIAASTMLRPTTTCPGLFFAAVFPGRIRAILFAAATLLSLGIAIPATAQVFVTQVSAPADGTYDRSLALHFTATFSAPVTVQGAPRLALRVGDRIRHATWMPPLGPSPAATSLTFVYHPEPLDRDLDGITIVPQLDLNGGAIRAMDTTPVHLAFAPPDTRGVYVTLRPLPSPRILGLTTGTESNPAELARGQSFLLRGTADGASRVTVGLVDVGIVGSVTAAPNGAWSMPYPSSLLSPGTHRLVATAETAGGLVSAPSAPLDLRIGAATSAGAAK